MSKSSIMNFDCNFLDMEGENSVSEITEVNLGKVNKKSLSSCVNYFCSNPVLFGTFNSELSNKKAIYLALKLAQAVDKNAINEIKNLKKEYGVTKEFAEAKAFLNKQCKQVWNIFENKKSLICPQEAMKVLGISNKPTLDSLFKDSLQFYEKEGSSTTVEIIQMILNNENFDYSFDDICEFLKTYKQKFKIDFNLSTIKYLCEKFDYNKKKLLPFGILPKTVDSLIKDLPINVKLKFFFINIF